MAVIPAQLQLRLRRRPERRASLIARPLNGSGYRNLLARLRGHLAVVERVEVFAGDGPAEALVTLGGPAGRIEPAAADLVDLATPVDRLPTDPTGVSGIGIPPQDPNPGRDDGQSAGRKTSHTVLRLPAAADRLSECGPETAGSGRRRSTPFAAGRSRRIARPESPAI